MPPAADAGRRGGFFAGAGSLPLYRTVRLLVWTAIAVWLAAAAVVLALRHVVLPRVADWQPQIEAAVSRAVGQPVRIGRVAARWEGMNPDLVLDDVAVLDRQGVAAFSLSRVEIVISWRSLWHRRPMLALLAVERPVLHVRREANGRITVAGMDAEGESDPALADWVLAQRRIRIRDAMIVWEDRLRGAPPLVLEDLQFGLDNHGSQHRFGFSAAPPADLAARIDVRGEVTGDIGEALDEVSGRIFVQLDYADLAGWRTWLDYPLDLPRGRGALRLWGDLADGKGGLVADLALEEVSLRLGRALPALDLASLRGRLEGRRKGDDWAVAGRSIELQTHGGIRVAPTDFSAEWKENGADGRVGGSASASFLDLGVIADLAAHLPLDARSRELLERHRPQGQVSEPRLTWRTVAGELEAWSLKAAFAGLGIAPGGYFPGARGMTGNVDANERGGVLNLATGAARLSLPAVFAEPDIDLERLAAKVGWKAGDGAIDVRLERLQFAGPHAAGTASGSYRFSGGGPGSIDLAATLDRADGTAVWRYMPRVISADVPAWLRRAIVAGKASDARLVLKGDLREFPFAEPGTGTFSVTARATGVRLDYAEGWPLIDDIDADLHFGAGMRVAADKGSIFGVRLGKVVAEIPDFAAAEEMLLIRGEAAGATADFLRFVDVSPVGETIDHFTRDMKAAGNGRLSLALDMPLRRVSATRVRGDFAMQGNRIDVVDGLPAITDVSGRLQVTENGVAARDLAGRAFGGPLKVQVRTAPDRVAVSAAGSAQIAEVARHFGWPLLDQLSGGANWKAEVGIRKRNADVVVESDLVGVVSPLPDPLNKNAAAPLPLRIERSQPDATREQYRIQLGDIGRGLLVRRNGALERGVFAVGSANTNLPERGLAIRIGSAQLDGDAWRRYLARTGNGGGATAGSDLDAVTVRADRLRLFGRDFHTVDVAVRPRDQGWQVALDMSEAAGDLYWREAGDGLLRGRLKRLYLLPSADAGKADTTVLNALPAMELAVDDLRIGEKALGNLQVTARNTQGAWNLDALTIRNPDGELKGKGVWRNTGSHQTRLDFELAADDVGRLLDRLGYVDAVRSGSATLTGDLVWNGPPTGIDYPSLSGSLAVLARKGQFNKLQPGVGKLLGLISLQSLPRRLTLDFRDIFSEGLAFDAIEGKMVVAKGVMRTAEPLAIRGPAAQIEIAGSTDLSAETQDLRVVVRPELGTVAAIGVAAINPVAGAATLLASAVGQNPLNRLFSYRYHVTGTWNDPVVNKEAVIVDPAVQEKK